MIDLCSEEDEHQDGRPSQSSRSRLSGIVGGDLRSAKRSRYYAPPQDSVPLKTTPDILMADGAQAADIAATKVWSSNSSLLRGFEPLLLPTLFKYPESSVEKEWTGEHIPEDAFTSFHTNKVYIDFEWNITASAARPRPNNKGGGKIAAIGVGVYVNDRTSNGRPADFFEMHIIQVCSLLHEHLTSL